jgi:hypothetical protein
MAAINPRPHARLTVNHELSSEKTRWATAPQPKAIMMAVPKNSAKGFLNCYL